MKRLLYLGFIALSLFLVQCKNSQKLLNEGNYEKSYKVSLKELKKGKASTKDKEILNVSLDKIYDGKIESILEFENGVSLEEGVNAYNGYNELVNNYEESLKYLSVKNNERYTSVLARKESLGQELYEDFKNSGIAALQRSQETDNRQFGREAYESFEMAQQYNATTEIEDLLVAAYEQAVTTIVVETSAPYNGSYDFDIQREFKRIEYVNSKFQRYFFDRNHKGADCVIRITFDQFAFGSDFQTYNRSFSRDVEVQRTRTNSAGEQVTTTSVETVSCNVTVEQTISSMRMEADIRVIAHSDHCRSSRDTYRDYYEDLYEVFQVSGDRRALPPEYNRPNNDRRVRDSDLVEIMIRDFYNQFSREYAN